MNANRFLGKDDARSIASSVGVVIPVFNRPTILCETLGHISAQTHKPNLVVIVDDGSTDDTPDRAEQWLSSSQPGFDWQVLRCQHMDASSARNRGLQLVSHLPWVVFLDSDDHWPCDFLERAVASESNKSSAVAASANRVYRMPSGQFGAPDDLRHMATDPISWFFARGAGIASCTLVRTEVAVRVGGWRRHLAAEDADFFSRIAAEGCWIHVPGVPVTFHQGSASQRCEEKNLTLHFDDRNLRWARDFEQIYKSVTHKNPDIDRGPLHDGLAYRWHAAAKQLVKLGRIQEARQACSRALYWNSTFLSAWRLRLRLALASSSHASRVA